MIRQNTTLDYNVKHWDRSSYIMALSVCLFQNHFFIYSKIHNLMTSQEKLK